MASIRERKRWRLVFEAGQVPISVVTIEGGDAAAVDEAVKVFKAKIRAAMELGGCRSVLVGVHVEGAACDHEVG